MQINVAPCVGAWIETKLTQLLARLIESHAAWGRGLKPIYFVLNIKFN